MSDSRLKQLLSDLDYVVAHLAVHEVEGKSAEEALIRATIELRAERGRDWRPKLLLSPDVSRATKEAIQADLEREGVDVERWMNELYEASMPYRHTDMEAFLGRLNGELALLRAQSDR